MRPLVCAALLAAVPCLAGGEEGHHEGDGHEHGEAAPSITSPEDRRRLADLLGLYGRDGTVGETSSRLLRDTEVMWHATGLHVHTLEEYRSALEEGGFQDRPDDEHFERERRALEEMRTDYPRFRETLEIDFGDIHDGVDRSGAYSPPERDEGHEGGRWWFGKIDEAMTRNERDGAALAVDIEEPALALELAARVQARVPEDEGATVTEARARLALGDHAGARRAASRVLSRNPGHAAARRARARAALLAGDRAAAERDLAVLAREHRDGWAGATLRSLSVSRRAASRLSGGASALGGLARLAALPARGTRSEEAARRASWERSPGPDPRPARGAPTRERGTAARAERLGLPPVSPPRAASATQAAAPPAGPADQVALDAAAEAPAGPADQVALGAAAEPPASSWRDSVRDEGARAGSAASAWTGSSLPGRTDAPSPPGEAPAVPAWWMQGPLLRAAFLAGLCLLTVSGVLLASGDRSPVSRRRRAPPSRGAVDSFEPDVQTNRIGDNA